MSRRAPVAFGTVDARPEPALRPRREARGADGGGAVRRERRPLDPDRVALAALAALALWLVLLLAARWPALRNPSFQSNSTLDAAFFAYAGELVRTGGVPYLTFWDHKPPLVYFIDAAALTLSRGQVWGVWLASLSALLASLALGYAAMRRAFGPVAAVLGASYFALSFTTVLASNLTEEYALPLQWWAALLLVARAPRTGGTGAFRTGAGLGVVGALAFLLRANLVGAPLSAALALTVVMLARRQAGAWARLALGALLGAGAVLAAVLAYLASHGALGAFWDQVFRYSGHYVAATWAMRARAGYAGLVTASVVGSLLLPVAGWLLAAIRSARSGRDHPALSVWLFALVWLPVELALVSVSGRPYTHYYVNLLPPLSFLAALAGAELLHLAARAGASHRRAWSWGALTAAVLAMAIPAVGNTALAVRDGEPRPARGETVTAAADYVRAHAPAGARVLVWGHAADVYLFSGRRPASRFVYALPLLTPGYADSALVRGFLAELRAADPPLIVDATPNSPQNEDLVPSLARWDPGWRFPTDLGPKVRYWATTPALEAVYDYVATNYRPVATVGPRAWVVYERARAAAPSR
ncbi:MAG: glycosyltransferase family 39 protein [Gemmatimonadaceae bacterium]